MAHRSTDRKEFLEAMKEAVAARVRTVEVKPGDVIHVQLGLSSSDMGDGQPPWIPGQEELEYVAQELREILPLGVRTWVTHLGVHIDAVVKDYED